MKEINNQKLIYFYIPKGTWIRVHKNLEILGLDKNKKIRSTYTRNFVDSVKNNNYKEKYEQYDVLYLDEFYDHEFDDRDVSNACYNIMKELIDDEKQIVMAGHGKLDSLVSMPIDIKKRIVSYNLLYGLDISDLTDINYIN